MVSRLKILPRTSEPAQYEVVVNGDVYRAEDGSFGSATSRGSETVITGTITRSQRDHKFLVQHDGPLNVRVRGPVTKAVDEDVGTFNAVGNAGAGDTPPGQLPVGSRTGPPGSVPAEPPPQAPAFGIPGRDSVPSDRVRKGGPFADKLLSDKSAVYNSRVGGLLQWHANQSPSAQLPVKAVISANNPARPVQKIKQMLGGAGNGSGTSGLGTDLSRESKTIVTFTISGSQAEALEQVEGANFYLEGTDFAATGGVPVRSGTTASGGGTQTNGKASTQMDSEGSSGDESEPESRVISGVSDSVVGAGLFAFGTAMLAWSMSASGE